MEEKGLTKQIMRLRVLQRQMRPHHRHSSYHHSPKDLNFRLSKITADRQIDRWMDTTSCRDTWPDLTKADGRTAGPTDLRRCEKASKSG